MNTLFAKIFDELKTVPITMLFMCGIYFAVAVLWNDHVSQADFRELKTQMGGVQYTLQRDHADSEIHKMETELFQLKQHVTESKTPVDQIYYQRIDELTNRHAELMRQVDQLDRAPRP